MGYHIDCFRLGWGQWTPWGPCSVGCGGGTRRRSKPCASEVLCGRDEIQVEPCNLDPCPGEGGRRRWDGEERGWEERRWGGVCEGGTNEVRDSKSL